MRREARYRHPRRVRRVLASLVRVVCPEGAVRLGLVDALVDHAELSVDSFPPMMRQALAAGLTTYDLAAAAWPPARGRTASRLDRERAEAWFLMWWESRLAPQRELARAAKAILCLAYYEAPAVQAEMGYTPQAWIEQVKRRRLTVHGGAIVRHQDSLLARDPLPSSSSVAAVGRAATAAGEPG